VIIFRADGNSTIGVGHLMRCSAVAKAAAAAGEEVCFLVSPDSGTELLTKQGFAVHRMKKGGALGWDPDEAVSAIAALRPSAVLADTYRVDDTALKKLADAAELVYLDDLYAFDYPVRTIINYNLEASVERYRPTAYPGRRLYLGASWFPVREQIAQAAEHGKNAGARLRPAVQTVLITTGATDQAGMMRQMLRLSEDFRSVRFLALTGACYTEDYRTEIGQYAARQPNVSVLSWTDDMGALYASCDLVIAPGSTTVYEAFTVGTPCISYCFADNQIDQCRIMKKKGMAPCAGDFRKGAEPVCRHLQELLEQAMDLTVRTGWHSAFSDVFDGHGADRIAQILQQGKM
jgi:UDP-2,4-diacetamido-2,4,6-trideoxy-beta-L-altropyranose hydrolase